MADRQLVLGEPSSTENSLLFDSDTMLLRSSVTKLEDDGVVVVMVVVVVLVERTVVVVVALIVVDVVLAVVVLVVVEALVVPFLVSFETSFDEIEMELGGRETTVASVLS